MNSSNESHHGLSPVAMMRTERISGQRADAEYDQCLARWADDGGGVYEPARRQTIYRGVQPAR